MLRGEWSEDELQAKRIRKHETTIWINSETYRSPVRAPSCEKPFEHIKYRLEGCNDGGHSRQNYQQ